MVEHEQHGHHHHTGITWLDGVLAGSAILISVVSLIVSVQHGRTMEKLVAANELQVKAATLPILRFGTGNLDDQNKPVIQFHLTNGGTGPAVIEWFTLRYNGKDVQSAKGLVKDCCDPDNSSPLRGYLNNSVSRQTMTAGQSIVVLAIRPWALSKLVYDTLDTKERFKVEASACYCSVLDECWVTDFEETRPRDVKSCSDARLPSSKTIW